MADVLGHYLASIAANLRLEPSTRDEVLRELEMHMEDRVEEFKQDGFSQVEAEAASVELLDSAKIMSRRLYEAHSQGSWLQALLASMPHLLFGLVFTLNWWQAKSWLLVFLLLILLVAIYGWGHGKPTWIFPWLGYSLLPVVVAGVLLLYLPRGWSWLAFLLYIPLALRLFYIIAIQTIKKDWLYSSLMFFQVPIIVGWGIVAWRGQFHQLNLELLDSLAPGIGVSFLALALTVAFFIRLRQRALKIMVLFVAGLLTLTLVIYQASGGLSLAAFLFIILTMFGLFLTPALLERQLKRTEASPRRREGRHAGSSGCYR